MTTMDNAINNRLAKSVLLCLLTLAAGPASRPVVQPAPATPAATPSPIPMTDLTNDQYHVHLKYPTDWKVVDPPVNNQVISLQTPATKPGDTAFGVVGLRVQTGPGDVSDEQILKAVSGEMVTYTFNHGGKKITIKPDKLGDLPARRITFDLQNPTGSSRVMCVIAVRHREEYVVTIAAPASQFDQLQSGVEEMLKSFEWSE